MTTRGITDACAAIVAAAAATAVAALSITGAVVALNAVTLPPAECRCDYCACDAGPPPDPLDEHSTIVIPSPFPERQ